MIIFAFDVASLTIVTLVDSQLCLCKFYREEFGSKLPVKNFFSQKYVCGLIVCTLPVHSYGIYKTYTILSLQFNVILDVWPHT